MGDQTEVLEYKLFLLRSFPTTVLVHDTCELNALANNILAPTLS